MKRLVQWKGHAWLALPARVYLGVVFFMACIHKIGHPEVFALDVASYQFLPTELVNLFAIIVPWLEAVVAIMLIVGFRVRAAALLVALLMVAFMIALGSALAKGLEMSCGCFAAGVGEEDPISAMTMLRDSVWLVLALYVLAFDRDALGLDRLLTRRATAATA